MSNYRYTQVKIGDEVQLNDNFIILFNPLQELIDKVFIVLDVQGNMLLVDNNIFDNFNPKNTLLRMWVKPYINPLTISKVKKISKHKSTNIIKEEVIDTPVDIPIKPAVKEIQYKSKKKIDIVPEINDFFTIE